MGQQLVVMFLLADQECERSTAGQWALRLTADNCGILGTWTPGFCSSSERELVRLGTGSFSSLTCSDFSNTFPSALSPLSSWSYSRCPELLICNLLDILVQL